MPEQDPALAGVGPAIIHVDMDAFFASVELRRRPELRGQPVVVGGDGRRGVVAAASYEARVFGIRSAMPSAQARRLCPHAVFLPGDHAHYAEVSRLVMGVFESFTPLVEPLSLDEAFLDVAGAARLHGDGVTIAHAIRDEVFTTTELTCSVGLAPNKFLAKLASEAAKPDVGPAGPILGSGVHVIEVAGIQAFLDRLPVRAIWGVGPATATRLDRLGVSTVAELRRVGVDALVATLGRAQGRHLFDLAHGRDDRPVVPDVEPKSVSHEETFPLDLYDPARLDAEIVRMADAVGGRLRAGGRRGRVVQLKLRFSDFSTITRSVTLDAATDSGAVVARAAKQLLGRIDPTPGVRLLGVGVAGFVAETEGEQLRFDSIDAPTAVTDPGPVGASALDWRTAEAAIDDIRNRFGTAAIAPASSLGERGLRPKRRGDQQKGPTSDPPT